MRKPPAGKADLHDGQNLKKTGNRPEPRKLRCLEEKIAASLWGEDAEIPRGRAQKFKEAVKEWLAPVLERYGNDFPYHLPVCFADWNEWEEVVSSMLKAKISLEHRPPKWWGSGVKEMRELFKRDLIMDCRKGITKDLWDEIFDSLVKDSSVSPSHAFNFFQKMRRHHRISPVLPDRLDEKIINQWVQIDPSGSAGLCALDYMGIANHIGYQYANASGMAHRIRKLGLKKCAKRTRK